MTHLSHYRQKRSQAWASTGRWYGVMAVDVVLNMAMEDVHSSWVDVVWHRRAHRLSTVRRNLLSIY